MAGLAGPCSSGRAFHPGRIRSHVFIGGRAVGMRSMAHLSGSGMRHPLIDVVHMSRSHLLLEGLVRRSPHW